MKWYDSCTVQRLDETQSSPYTPFMRRFALILTVVFLIALLFPASLLVQRYFAADEEIPYPEEFYTLVEQSPDGAFYAAVGSTEQGEVVQIFDALTQAPVSNIGIGKYFGWHPNSQQILFYQDLTQDRGLWLFDVRTKQHQLVAQPPTIDISGASISPDGAQLAYATNNFDIHQVWLANSDGTNGALILESTGTVYVFDWSPDSQQILLANQLDAPNTTAGFESAKDVTGEKLDEIATLFLLDSETGQTDALNAPFLMGFGHTPSFSPDGKKILSVAEAVAAPHDCHAKDTGLADEEECFLEDTALYLETIDSGTVELLAEDVFNPEWDEALDVIKVEKVVDEDDTIETFSIAPEFADPSNNAKLIPVDPEAEFIPPSPEPLELPTLEAGGQNRPSFADSNAAYAQFAGRFLRTPYFGTRYITAFQDHQHPDYKRNFRFALFDGSILGPPVNADCSGGGGWAWMHPTGRCIYYEGHAGTDVRMRYEPVLGAADGTVVQSRWWDANNRRRGLGMFVELDHGNGYSTLYGHLSALTIPSAAEGGKTARALDQIGTSGNTGNSSGPHLHFEVRFENDPVDPFGGHGQPYLWADGGWDTGETWTKDSLWIGQPDRNYGAVFTHDTPADNFVKGRILPEGSRDCAVIDCPFWVDVNDVGNDGDMLYTFANNDTLDYWALWNAPPGRYEVEVYIPKRNATTWWAKYWLVAAGSYNLDSYLVVDQYGVSERWVSLGVYEFGNGAPYAAILIGDDTGEGFREHCFETEEQDRCQVGVDAIRFRQVLDPDAVGTMPTAIPPTKTPTPTPDPNAVLDEVNYLPLIIENN